MLNLWLALAQQTHYPSWLGNLGLCWQILEAPGVFRFHWHNGRTGGYVSFLGLACLADLATREHAELKRLRNEADELVAVFVASRKVSPEHAEQDRNH